jgi:hypothetical protein
MEAGSTPAFTIITTGYLRVAFFVSPPSERTHGNEVLTGGMISA